MSDDLISRQAALKRKFMAYYTNGAEIRQIEAVPVREIEKLQAVDVAPAERGKWLIRYFGADAKCSKCGMYVAGAYDMENADNYCRHCGTKMDGIKLETHDT